MKLAYDPGKYGPTNMQTWILTHEIKKYSCYKNALCSAIDGYINDVMGFDSQTLKTLPTFYLA